MTFNAMQTHLQLLCLDNTLRPFNLKRGKQRILHWPMIRRSIPDVTKIPFNTHTHTKKCLYRALWEWIKNNETFLFWREVHFGKNNPLLNEMLDCHDAVIFLFRVDGCILFPKGTAAWVLCLRLNLWWNNCICWRSSPVIWHNVKVLF